jgi:hypothetical protein
MSRPSFRTSARRATAVATLALALFPAAFAQTLARRGWVDRAANANPWWQHAIFCEPAVPGPNATGFRSVTLRLDSLRSIGIDALLLPAPTVPAGGAAMPDLDPLDDLLRQASAHGIRVLLILHAPAANADLTGLARFWLNHGIAGLYVPTPPATSANEEQAIVAPLRKLAAANLGQRIILSDADLTNPESPPGPTRRRGTTTRSSRNPTPSPEQLSIVHLGGQLTLDASTLRPLLVTALTRPNLLLDIHPPANGPLAQISAVLAMLPQPATLIGSSANLVLEAATEQPAAPAAPEEPSGPAPLPPQPPPGVYLPYVPYVPPAKSRSVVVPAPPPLDPLTNWYQRLAALHQDNAAIRSGSKAFLDFDAQNTLVWINRPALPSPLARPVVVLCNLSASPVELSLTSALKSLNLKGWFLRTLMRSDPGMGGQNVDDITVPPYGVYIGELRL